MTEHRFAKPDRDVENWINTQRRNTNPKLLPDPQQSGTSKGLQKPLRGILKKPNQPSPKTPVLPSFDERHDRERRRSRSRSKPPALERTKPFNEEVLTPRKSHRRLPEPDSRRPDRRSPSPVPSLSSTVKPQLSSAGSSEVDLHMGPYNPNPRRETRKAKPRTTTKPLYSYGSGYPPAEKCNCSNYKNVAFLGHAAPARETFPSWETPVKTKSHKNKNPAYSYSVYENPDYFAAFGGWGYGSHWQALQVPGHAKRI